MALDTDSLESTLSPPTDVDYEPGLMGMIATGALLGLGAGAIAVALGAHATVQYVKRLHYAARKIPYEKMDPSDPFFFYRPRSKVLEQKSAPESQPYA